jgi:hypothetical protein
VGEAAAKTARIGSVADTYGFYSSHQDVYVSIGEAASSCGQPIRELIVLGPKS